MSVWAQSWAYERRLGKWRDEGKRSWKGDPGAKSALAAVATFADENGYAFCGYGCIATASVCRVLRSVDSSRIHRVLLSSKRISGRTEEGA